MAVSVEKSDWVHSTTNVLGMGTEYVYTLSADSFLPKLESALSSEGYALPDGFALPEMPTVIVSVQSDMPMLMSGTIEPPPEPVVWSDSSIKYLSLAGNNVWIEAGDDGETYIYSKVGDSETKHYWQASTIIDINKLYPVTIPSDEGIALRTDFSNYVIIGGGVAGIPDTNGDYPNPDVVGDFNIIMNGGTLGGIYGGSYAGFVGAASGEVTTTATVYGKIYIEINGGEVYAVYGGGYATGVDGHNSVSIVDGLTEVLVQGDAYVNGNVYGGGYATTNDSVFGINGSTKVTIKTNLSESGDPSIIGNVYGGSGVTSENAYGYVTVGTEVEIISGIVMGAVLGAGLNDHVGYTRGESNTIQATSTPATLKVTVHGDADVGNESSAIISEYNFNAELVAYNNVFGGGERSIINGNTNVIISGNAEVFGSVFGGNGISAAMEMRTTKALPINKNMNGQIVGSTNVQIAENAKVYNSVFGGGYKDAIGTERTATATTVEISGGIVGSHRSIYSGEVEWLGTGDVFGGGQSNRILGNTQVTINSGKIAGNVWGGIYYPSWINPAMEYTSLEGGVALASEEEVVEFGVLDGNTNVDIKGGEIGEYSEDIEDDEYSGEKQFTSIALRDDMFGGAVALYGNVFGGGFKDVITGNTDVEVTTGTIGADKEISISYWLESRSVNMHIGNVHGGSYGGVYSIGGEKSIAEEASGSLKVGGVIGGNTRVQVSGGTVGYGETWDVELVNNAPATNLISGNVFGGGIYDTITGSTDVDVLGSAIIGTDKKIAYNMVMNSFNFVHMGNVYGGTYGDMYVIAPKPMSIESAIEVETSAQIVRLGSIGGSTDVNVAGGTIGLENIEFDYNESSSHSRGIASELELSSVKTGNVFGGGLIDVIAQNTKVQISGGTLRQKPDITENTVAWNGVAQLENTHGSVYGAGSGTSINDGLYAVVGGYAEYNIPSLLGFKLQDHNAANYVAQEGGGNTEVHVQSTVNIPGSVYGGLSAGFLDVILGDTKVYVHNGTIAGSVYGGGSGVGLHGYKATTNPIDIWVVFENQDYFDENPLIEPIPGATSNTDIYILNGNIKGNVVGAGDISEIEIMPGVSMSLTSYVKDNAFIFVDEKTNLVGEVYRQNVENLQIQFTMEDGGDPIDVDITLPTPTVGGMATVVIENKTTKIAASLHTNNVDSQGDTPQISVPDVSTDVQNVLRLEQRSGWSLDRGHWVIRGDVHLPSVVTQNIGIVPKQELYMPSDTNLVADESEGDFVNQGYIITAQNTLDDSIETGNQSGQTNLDSRIYRGGLSGQMSINGAQNYTQSQSANPLIASGSANSIYSFLADGGKVGAQNGYNWAQGSNSLSETSASYTPSTAALGTFGYTVKTSWQHLFESVPGGKANNAANNLEYLANVAAEANASITVTAASSGGTSDNSAPASSSSTAAVGDDGDDGGDGGGDGGDGGGDGGDGGGDGDGGGEDNGEEAVSSSSSSSTSQSSSAPSSVTDNSTGGGGNVPDPPQIGEDGGITLSPTDPDLSIENVYVDGTELDPDQYSVDEDGNIILSPEFLATLGDGEHTIRISIDGKLFESTVIMENSVPLSAGNFELLGGWSLFDLLMTILTLLSPVVYMIIVRKQKPDEEEDENESEEDEEYITKKRTLTMVGGILLGIISLVLLLITQDFTLPMIFFDRFSIWFVIIFVVQTVVEIVFRRKRVDDEQQEQYTAG